MRPQANYRCVDVRLQAKPRWGRVSLRGKVGGGGLMGGGNEATSLAVAAAVESTDIRTR